MFGLGKGSEIPEFWIPPGGTEELARFGALAGTPMMFTQAFRLAEYEEGVPFTTAAGPTITATRVLHYTIDAFALRITDGRHDPGVLGRLGADRRARRGRTRRRPLSLRGDTRRRRSRRRPARAPVRRGGRRRLRRLGREAATADAPAAGARGRRRARAGSGRARARSVELRRADRPFVPHPPADRQKDDDAEQAAGDHPDRQEQPDRAERRLGRRDLDRRCARVGPARSERRRTAPSTRRASAERRRCRGSGGRCRRPGARSWPTASGRRRPSARPRRRWSSPASSEPTGLRLRGRERPGSSRSPTPSARSPALSSLVVNSNESPTCFRYTAVSTNRTATARTCFSLGGGERGRLRRLGDEHRLARLELLRLPVPGVREVDADEGDGADDDERGAEPGGPPAKPARCEPAHPVRIRRPRGGSSTRSGCSEWSGATAAPTS